MAELPESAPETCVMRAHSYRTVLYFAAAAAAVPLAIARAAEGSDSRGGPGGLYQFFREDAIRMGRLPADDATGSIGTLLRPGDPCAGRPVRTVRDRRGSLRTVC
jgi:hypothetical protein